MQAALITYLQAAPNTAEAPGEAAEAGHAGSGMRINSASRSGKNNSTFTTILKKERGIAADTAPDPVGGGATLTADADVIGEADEEAAADACSLLAQLMVLNTAAPPGEEQETPGEEQETPGEEDRCGLISAVNEPPGAPTGTPAEGIDPAAAALSAQAEIKAEAESSGRTAEMPEGKPSADSFNEVLDGIAGALKGELERSGTARDMPAAGIDPAAVHGNTAAEKSTVPAAGYENPASPAENSGVPATGRTGEITVKNTSAPSAVTAGYENTRVTAIPVKTDGDNGGSGPDDPGLQERNDGAAAAAGRPDAVLPDTGVKGAISAEKAAAAERVLNRFADDIMSVRGGSREIRIVLEPESLGIVTISVMKNENGITASIRSEDREIAAVISDQVQKLISSMESKGITVNDIDVAYSQTEQNTGFTRHGFSQARDESPKGSALPAERDTADDAPNPEIWQTLYDGGTTGDTTVDYRV